MAVNYTYIPTGAILAQGGLSACSYLQVKAIARGASGFRKSFGSAYEQK